MQISLCQVWMTVFTYWKYCPHVEKWKVSTTSVTDWVVIMFLRLFFCPAGVFPHNISAKRKKRICLTYTWQLVIQLIQSESRLKRPKECFITGIKVTWFLTHALVLFSHIVILKHRPCTKRSSGIFVLLLLEWSQWEGGGKVNCDLWLPVLHCVTSVGSWSPNCSIGSALTWSAQWQESNIQTDLIWQHETRADLALLSYRVWPRGHHGNSWEASSGMKHQ